MSSTSAVNICNITYRKNVPLAVGDIVELYSAAGLKNIVELYPDAGLEGRAEELTETMYKNSNLVISAWDGNRLVGVARSMADFAFFTYLSDLAVRKEYQKGGIGKELIRLTKEAVGESSTVLLLAAPAAMEYYPKVGFTKVNNAFVIGQFAAIVQ